MARGIFQHVVQEEDGDIRASATVTLYEMNGTTPLAASVFAASSGGSPIGNVLTANALGIVEGYIEIAQYVKAEVGGVQTTQAFWPDPGQITTLTQTQTLTNKTLTSPTISNPTLTGNILGGKLFDAGGMVFNVRAHGSSPNAVGMNQQDETDSDAFDATIAAIRAWQSIGMPALGGEGRFAQMYIPAGRYNLIRPFDLDGLVGMTVSGDGRQSTVIGIVLDHDESDAAYWEDKPVISMVGSNFMHLRDFSVDLSNTGASHPIPECGFLMAANADMTAEFPGWPANTANINFIEAVRVSGAFTMAAHINYACPSSVYVECRFDRSKSANTMYPNGLTIDEAALILTRDNEVGCHGGGIFDLLDPASGAGSCSDLTFIRAEIHDGAQIPATPPVTNKCVCSAVWIQEGHDIAFLGGNWLSGATGAEVATGAPSCGYLRLSVGNEGAGTGPRGITIENIHWYVEGNVESPAVGVRLTSNRANDFHALRSDVEFFGDDSTEINHPGPAIIASDVTIRNCQVMLGATGFINGGTAGAGGSTVANFMRWKVENVRLYIQSSGRINDGPMIVFGGSESGLFTDSVIECMGASVTGNGSAYVRGRLVRPGTMTGLTMTHGDFEIRGGGAASLAASGTVYYGEGSANATEASVVPVTVTQSCRIFNLRPRVSAAPDNGGGTQTLTYTLRKATPATGFTFADTALTGTITETSVIGSDTTHFVDLAAGDVLTLKIVAGAGTTTNAWATWSVSAIPI